VRIGIDIDAAFIEAVKQAVRDSEPSALVGRLIIDRVPVVFDGDADAYRDWREEMASRLSVDPCNVFVVGSACVGCSVSPYKDWNPFGPHSDVDIAVISSYHFDLAWRTMRQFRRADLNGAEWREIEFHRTNYIYWGCIATDKILGRMPFAKEWLEAATLAASLGPTANREINFRVYRDVGSLRDYTINGLRRIKAEML
jgi:hypothetical protein